MVNGWIQLLRRYIYDHESWVFLLGRLYYSIVPSSEMSGYVYLFVYLFVCLFICVDSPG